MNDTALMSQDSNRPSYSAVREDFGESLDRIGLKIRNLQNELTSFTSKKKVHTNTVKPKGSLKEKLDIHSKENRSQTLTKSDKKTSITSRTYSKGTESTFRSLFENSLDITQSLGNIETQENDDEGVISQEAREKLQRIFEFYSRFGDKSSPFQLRLSKYRKMMIDSGLTESTSLENLDILFLGHNQHKTVIEFKAFLKLLSKIACARYPLSSYTPDQGLHLLLTRYILPLNNQIESNSDLYDDNGASTMRGEPIEEGVLVIVKSVFPILSKIYKEYFSWEIKGIEGSALLGHSEVAFWTFLKEFEICPGMITKTMGQSLWVQREKSKGFLSNLKENTETEAWFKKKDIGMLFKFTKFCEFLVSLSFMVYRNQGEGIQTQLNEAEQVAALLEKLQYTRGMAKFAHKGSLIVPKDTLEKVVRKQSIIKDKLCLCPTEERNFGKTNLLSTLSEDYQVDYRKHRNKIISEIHNRITSQ